MNSTATEAVASPDTAPLDEDRAHSLFRWNASLAPIHAVQGLVILALSFARDPVVTSPVVTSYLTFDTATETLVPAQSPLFELPIGPAVAVFFFMSAIAHACWPGHCGAGTSAGCRRVSSPCAGSSTRSARA